jgi:hypothetical protein
MPIGGIRPQCTSPGCSNPNHARGLCRKHWRRVHYLENADRLRAYQRARGSRAEYNKAWREANKERYRASRLRHYEKNKEKYRRKRQTPEFKNWHNGYARSHNRTLKGRYHYMRGRAKEREIACTLSFEEYCSCVNGQLCYYCNGALEEAGVGLDRIDSSRGYELGNVRACCRKCNVAKNDMTEQEFRDWVAKVYERFEKS